MAVDNKVPYSAPGIAGFEKQTWGNRQNWQYGDTPALTTLSISITSGVGGLTIAFLDVLDAAGGPALQAGATAADKANYIAATDITIPASTTVDFPVYVQGHFEMNALNWDASYTTDAMKKAAFQGSLSPTIYVSKGNYDSDAIYP